MTAENLGHAIVQQVQRHFHRLPETRYYLSVVHVKPDQQYHYFFYIKRRGVSTRSLPVGQGPANLADLTTTLTVFRQTYQLPIELRNFSRETRRQFHRLTR